MALAHGGAEGLQLVSAGGRLGAPVRTEAPPVDQRAHRDVEGAAGAVMDALGEPQDLRQGRGEGEGLADRVAVESAEL